MGDVGEVQERFVLLSLTHLSRQNRVGEISHFSKGSAKFYQVSRHTENEREEDITTSDYEIRKYISGTVCRHTYKQVSLPTCRCFE